MLVGGEVLEQCGQLVLPELGKAGHAASAVANNQGDLLVRHLVADPDQRRKGRENALAIIPMTDGAMVCVGLSTRDGRLRTVRCCVARGRIGWRLLPLR